jgi:glycine/D-amino acid oxidase-like deaminating enzyme/nitrite reductase/ring-hydroxylating ferredoxin subunit
VDAPDGYEPGLPTEEGPVDPTQESLWMATSSGPARPALRGAERYDVAVLGAGITGMTAALLLKREGLRVAVLEAGAVCQGVTGHTTAKVTSLHQLVYAELASRFDDDTARVYGEANEAAIALVALLVADYGIDCAWERRPAVTFTEREDEVDQVRAEAETAARVGLPARLVTDTDLPFPVRAAVQFDGQGQFHPRDYVLGLAEQVAGDGCAVYEHSRVVDVRDGDPCRVETPEGSVEASSVIVATHLPLLDRGLFFAKAHPSRSYALAATVEGPLPDGMYINVEQPTRSVRPYVRGATRMVVVSGEGHKPGEDEDEARHWDALAEWTRRHFAVISVDYLWSAQDYTPVDKIPFVGKVTRTSSNIWTATGFRKWGMTGGTAAAMILADLVAGRDNPWAATFDANRVTPVQSARSFVTENLDVARHFVADRITEPEDAEAAERLGPGEGTVVRIDGTAYAVCRDDDGALYALSPVCRHMGCHVRWNTAERSWDCPCHGSRYTPDGRVIQGPAVHDLEPRELPERGS